MERFGWLAVMALVATLGASAEVKWSDDLPGALARAAAAGQVVVVQVNGSDWCLPGREMEAETFTQADFEAWSRTVVLAAFDYPRAAPQTEAARVRAQAFLARYPFDQLPATFVLDPRGRALGRHQGRIPAGTAGFAAWVAEASARAPVLDRLEAAVAQAAPGPARAQAEDALFRQAEAWDLTVQYGTLPRQIVKDDAQGKAGLKARYQARNAYDRFLATWAARENPRAAAADLAALADQAQAWPDLRQKMLFTLGMVWWNAVADEKAARDALRRSRDLDPSSAVGQRAAELLDRLP